MERLIASLLVISSFGLAQGPEGVDFSVLPTEVAGQLLTSFDPRGNALTQCLSEENLSLPESVRIQPIDFSNAVDGFIIQGMHRCLSSATGNAALLGFYPKDGRWEPVLSATGQRFDVRDPTTNGLRDLEIWQHDSASRSIRLIYRFDGSEYDVQACDRITFSDPAGARLVNPLQESCGDGLPQDPLQVPGAGNRLPDQIADRILRDLDLDNPQVRQCLQQYDFNLNTQVRVMDIDVAPNAEQMVLEVDADGPCLSAGNGWPILLYRKVPESWDLIFRRSGFSLMVLETTSSGLADIWTFRPGGRGQYHETFRFDGTRYQLSQCEASWLQYGPPRTQPLEMTGPCGE